MAFVSSFCFSFSVRLGAIIVASFVIIQALLGTIGCLFCFEYLHVVSDKLISWVEELGVEGNFFSTIAKDPWWLVIILGAYFCALFFSCVLLLLAAFQCKTLLTYPFIILYPIYIMMLLLALVLWLSFVKQDDGNGLGALILYSNLGGFTLLFYFYTWICVVSFTQVVRELQKRLEKKFKIVEAAKVTRTRGFDTKARNTTESNKTTTPVYHYGYYN